MLLSQFSLKQMHKFGFFPEVNITRKVFKWRKHDVLYLTAQYIFFRVLLDCLLSSLSPGSGDSFSFDSKVRLFHQCRKFSVHSYAESLMVGVNLEHQGSISFSPTLFSKESEGCSVGVCPVQAHHSSSLGVDSCSFHLCVHSQSLGRLFLKQRTGL